MYLYILAKEYYYQIEKKKGKMQVHNFHPAKSRIIPMPNELMRSYKSKLAKQIPPGQLRISSKPSHKVSDWASALSTALSHSANQSDGPKQTSSRCCFFSAQVLPLTLQINLLLSYPFIAFFFSVLI